MIDLVLERIVFVSPRSERDEVDDFIIFRLTNASTGEISLHDHLIHRLTDANLNHPVQWADDISNNSSFPQLRKKIESDDGIDEFLIETRGTLKPGQTRTIGVRTIRKGLVAENGIGILYSDPIRLERSNSKIYRNLSVRYTVVYPPKDEIKTYKITANGASIITARSATWDISPILGTQNRVLSELTEDDLPIAGELDICICKLLSIKASAIVDLNYDCTPSVSDIIRTLNAEEALWEGVDFSGPKDAVTKILSVGTLDRYAQIELALHAFYQLYRECVQGKPNPKRNAPKEILVTKRQIAGKAFELRTKNLVTVPFPYRFAESLHYILQFAYSIRKTGYAWPKKPLEKDFQAALHQYLVNNGAPTERELSVGPGRVDILLIETPVEMKTVSLGNAPNLAASKYQEQAAEYPSRLGYCIGILLILDTEDRSSEKLHTPHLPEETEVSVVESRPGVGGHSKTLIVTIRVAAFPPKPSALKTPTGSRSRKRTSTI